MRSGLVLRLSVLLAAVISMSGCAKVSPRGEWDLISCSDGLDNDGDGYTDCVDPDCWAFRCEGATAGAANEPDRAGKPATGPLDASLDATVQDAATMSQSKPDAGGPLADAAADSGRVLDGGCGALGAGCDSGISVCTGPECAPFSVAGEYVIYEISARVPERNVDGVCFDSDQTLFCIPPDCGQCWPDPYIVIWQNSMEIGRVTRQLDTLKPSWTNARIQISLASDSEVISFNVWDSDPSPLGTDNRPTRIYSCNVMDLATQLESGELKCTPPSNTTIESGAQGAFEVTAKIRRVPAE